MEAISLNQVKWVRSLQQKKNRDAEGVFVAEGRKCIEELTTHFELVLHATVGENCSARQLEQMSSLRAPQGEIAVFKRERLSTHQGQTLQVILALDGVQDPGNLGTIIRTADWFGVKKILCSRETADIWNPKVVQATMGALGRVEAEYGELGEMIAEIQETRKSGNSEIPIYGTVLDGKNIYEEGAIEDKTRGIIVMGNEGNGITKAIRKLITHPLYIPSAVGEHVESLNVAIATGIVLAEFRRG